MQGSPKQKKVVLEYDTILVVTTYEEAFAVTFHKTTKDHFDTLGVGLEFININDNEKMRNTLMICEPMCDDGEMIHPVNKLSWDVNWRKWTKISGREFVEIQKRERCFVLYWCDFS